MKSGKIIPHGVKLQPHELDTVLFFTNLGKDIELIPPCNIANAKTADFIMEKISWEVKSPKGNSKYLIRDTLRRASAQSRNIILDLRRTKQNQTKSLNDAKRYFKTHKNIKKLKIITKDSQLLDIKKSQ